MKPKKRKAWNLIGSSPSLESLIDLIERRQGWSGVKAKLFGVINAYHHRVWDVYVGDKHLEDFRIIEKRGRFRFELYLD